MPRSHPNVPRLWKGGTFALDDQRQRGEQRTELSRAAASRHKQRRPLVASELHVVGAFYMLEGNRDRMLPVEAHLNVKPGAVSTVKLGGGDSAFELPSSERQFARSIEIVR